MSFTRRLVRISTRRTVSRISLTVMQARSCFHQTYVTEINSANQLARSRHRHGAENFLDEIVAGDGLGFGFVGEDDAVTEDIRADVFDVFGGHVATTLQQR